VDGFRLDAINFAMHDPRLTDNPEVVDPFSPKRPFDFQHHFYNQSQAEMVPFIEDLGKVVRSFGADRFTVAEVGGEQALAEMKLFTAGSDRFNTSYGFDFLSAPCLTPHLILDTLANWPGRAGEGWPSWAFSNHDAPRVVSRWGSLDLREQWAKLLLTLLMTLRGNVFLYQGEELGLTQAAIPFERLRDPEAIANWPMTQGRDGARTPMPWSDDQPHAGFSAVEPWLPIPPDHSASAVSQQNGDANSVLAAARELIELRRSSAALRGGKFEPLDLPAPLLGFDRGGSSGWLRCLFNLSNEPCDCAELASGRLVLSHGVIDLEHNILGGLAVCVLELPD
jgi:alpha-glucosidase